MKTTIKGYIFIDNIDFFNIHLCEDCIKNKNCELQDKNKGESDISHCIYFDRKKEELI